MGDLGVRFSGNVSCFAAVFRACGAGVLSFASPKESSQRKGDPVFGAGLRPVPCATRAWRGRRKLGAAPLKHACPLSAKPCVARHLSRGKVKPAGFGRQSGIPALFRHDKAAFSFQFVVVPDLRAGARFRDGFPPPMRRAEQRSGAGSSRLAMFEPHNGEFSQPPGLASSAGKSAQPTAKPGVPFSLATFFWASKRKYARAAARKTAVTQATTPEKQPFAAPPHR